LAHTDFLRTDFTAKLARHFTYPSAGGSGIQSSCDGLDTQRVIIDKRIILLRLFCNYTKVKKKEGDFE